MKSLFAGLLAVAISICFWSCKETSQVEAIDPNATGKLRIEFDNVVGSTNLALGSASYKNALGESFTVSKFDYFVSNIELKKADGSVQKIPNSYFLVKESDAATQEIELAVPQGDYVGVAFTIGVDSTKSVADISTRTGILDVAGAAKEMYWSWNSGYIFMKLEGTSPVAPAGTDGSHAYQFHVGGFGGMTAATPNNLRRIALTAPTTATVRKNIAPVIHLMADAAKVMTGTTNISLAKTSNVHMPVAAIPLADNYQQMFSVAHVHNDPL